MCSLSDEGTEMMTAEKLKEAVRQYADSEHPGWAVASVTLCRGLGEQPETLIVTPRPAASPPSLPAKSPR